MFDIGGLELLVIGVIALIVVGPKDLPGMFRTVGRFVGRMRGMAREFQRSMEAAADDAGIKDAVDTVQKAGNSIKDPLAQVKSSATNYAKSMASDDGAKAGAKAESKSDTTPSEKPKSEPKKGQNKCGGRICSQER